MKLLALIRIQELNVGSERSLAQAYILTSTTPNQNKVAIVAYLVWESA
jgi:hypothetical protein